LFRVREKEEEPQEATTSHKEGKVLEKKESQDEAKSASKKRRSKSDGRPRVIF